MTAGLWNLVCIPRGAEPITEGSGLVDGARVEISPYLNVSGERASLVGNAVMENARTSGDAAGTRRPPAVLETDVVPSPFSVKSRGSERQERDPGYCWEHDGRPRKP